MNVTQVKLIGQNKTEIYMIPCAAENSPMPETLKTIKLRNGWVVLAHERRGTLEPLRYANKTQANKAFRRAHQLYTHAAVVGFRPFYVRVG